MSVDGTASDIVYLLSDFRPIPLYVWKEKGKVVHSDVRPEKDYLNENVLFNHVVDRYFDPNDPRKLYNLKLVDAIPDGFYTTDYDLLFVALMILGFIRGYMQAKGSINE